MNEVECVAFVQALDDCWIQGRLDELANYLADDIVIVSPDGKRRVTGLAAAVDSYRQFISFATIDFFRTFGHAVTLRGETAVVEYEWDMTWAVNGTKHHQLGRELLVLACRNQQWRVVWRTQIPQSGTPE